MWNNGDLNSTNNKGDFMDISANTSSGSTSTSLKKGINLTPVMIGHLNEYGEDLKVWGDPIKQVTFVAILMKIEEVTTRVNFEFMDETGIITGIKWLSADEKYTLPVKINSYVRIYATIRSEKKKNYVLVLKIRPLDELNELMTHLMEVTFISLHGNNRINNVIRNDQKLINDTLNNTNQGSYSEPDDVSSLSREQNLILKVIKKSIEEYGIERSEIKKSIPYMESKVDDILEFLVQEGHIYTTATDNHFKYI